MKSLIEQFKAAKQCGTPLVAIEAADPFAVMDMLGDSMNGNPRFLWTAVQGLKAMDEKAAQWLTQKKNEMGMVSDDPDAQRANDDQFKSMTGNPMTFIADVAPSLPNGSILFLLDFHRFLSNDVVAVGVHCIRNPYKASRRMFVMLGPSFSGSSPSGGPILPLELRRDVVILEDPLPDPETLGKIAWKLYKNAKVEPPADLDPVIDSVKGLGAYEAEQALSMAMTKQGVNIEDAWARKIKSVPKGLTLTIRKKKIPIAGNKQVMEMARLAFNGKKKPAAVLRIDEFEKQTGGAEGDTTGVSQDMSSTFLQWMEDNEYTGIIAVGIAGTGKSLISEMIGVEFDKPTMTLDVGGTKEKWVGASEGNIREALKSAKAIASGPIFVVATCNRIVKITPEIRRRFTEGIWYFDLLTPEEQIEAWKIYFDIYGLKDEPLVDLNLTGAEIRNIARRADNYGISARQAAQFTVPVAISNAKEIAALRDMAHGTFLSTSYPGAYKKPSTMSMGGVGDSGRAFDLADGLEGLLGAGSGKGEN